MLQLTHCRILSWLHSGVIIKVTIVVVRSPLPGFGFGDVDCGYLSVCIYRYVVL
jgi:hypothetical protein